MSHDILLLRCHVTCGRRGHSLVRLLDTCQSFTRQRSLTVSQQRCAELWFDITCSCGTKLCIQMVCLSEKWSTQRSNCFPINSSTQKSQTRGRIIHENGKHIQRSGKVCLKSFCCCFYCCLKPTELI